MKKIHFVIPFIVVTLLLLGCKNSGSNVAQTYPSVDVPENTTIQSPLTIHINSEGVWQAFEGELGTVALVDKQGNELGTAIMKSEDGNWMTAEPAPFVATLKFNVTEDQEGSLVFKNNYVSDEGGDAPQEFRIPVVISSKGATASAIGEIVTTWCFAEKTKAMNSPKSKEFNYQFVQLGLDANNNVSGWIVSAPYGTDGMNGHVNGKYDPDSKTFFLNQVAMGEGQLYESERNFQLGDGFLRLDYDNPDKSRAQLKLYDCVEYDALYKEFQNGILKKRVNTADRSRLNASSAVKDYSFPKGKLETLKFMEVETDLDNDFETREFLLYLMDPMVYCGSGGCTLYIVDEKGNTLSYMTVTKLPIYTVMPTAEAQQKDKGKWRDLFVWSNGSYRQLKHNGTAYPDNPSMEPEVSEQEIISHPEKYRMLLNYLD